MDTEKIHLGSALVFLSNFERWNEDLVFCVYTSPLSIFLNSTRVKICPAT